MKLRNKKTGEIGNLVSTNWDEVVLKVLDDNGVQLGKYTSLAELNEEWEDAPEEPKGYWWICPGCADVVHCVEDDGDKMDEYNKKIGNYFETKEEAEKAVEKLKAWKRLEDKGFKVDLWHYDGGNYQERIKTGRILFRVKDYEENDKDLDLLFGGEE